MRALVFPIAVTILLAGCGTQTPPPSSRAAELSHPAGSYSSGWPAGDEWIFDDYWREVEMMGALRQQADVVLEAEGVDRFLLLNPVSEDVQAVRGGLDGYLHFIPKRKQSGGGFVVLIVPALQLPHPTKKIMDEVILDVRDAALSRGYQRFVVGVRHHGLVTQRGLRSRDQIAEEKSSLERFNEHLEKDPAK